MKDEVRKSFMDILQSAEKIGSFVSDIDLKGYEKSAVIRRAVERDFQIIGEALNRIKKIDPTILEEISEHYRIIGFRNVLAHGYDVVDERIVWNAIKNHLPILVTEIHSIMDI